ncbi:peptidoglycan DD-metalloendopeptidase family protein [Demequina sp.]|uniref:M23 family metallopeptidase n=1 Tax=Demequina sp. TaxID=2050685 RepID=UPI003D09C0E9
MILRNRFYAGLAALIAVVTCSGWAFAAAVATETPAGIHQDNDYDDQISDANKDAQKIKDKLDDLESELEDTDAAIVKTNKKITELEDKLPGLRKELADARETYNAAVVQQKIVADKLKAAIAQDKDITKQIEDDNARIEELKITLGALAREQYMGEGTSDSLAIVFGSESSSDFVKRFAAQHSAARVQTNALDEIEEIAATNRNRGARQDAVREYIEELKEEADALVEEAAAAKTVAEEKKAAVDKALDDLSDLKATLAEQRKDAIAKQKQLEAQQDKVRDKIRELVKKKLAAQNHGNPTPLGKGYLSFPTKVPYITSNYGMRYHPILHYWRLHAGTDFRAYCGTAIYAAAEGKVEWATQVGGFGNQVMIDHGFVKGNSVMTSYNHLSRFSVHTGQYVVRGQIVGYSGSTGTSTACHLHFEVYVNGNTVNPISILGPVP